MRKRWWAVIPVVLLLVLGVSAFWQFQRNKAEAAAYNRPDLLYGVMIRTPSMKKVADQRRASVINYAKTLREKWRLWALKNRSLLIAAKNSNPNDEAMMRTLYKGIPEAYSKDKKANPISEILTPDVHSLEDLGRPDIVLKFSWNIDHRDNKIFASMKEDFPKYKTFSISQSMNAGRSSVTLWANGWITETTYQNNDTPGEPSLIKGTPTEIMPPYDFIK